MRRPGAGAMVICLLGESLDALVDHALSAAGTYAPLLKNDSHQQI